MNFYESADVKALLCFFSSRWVSLTGYVSSPLRALAAFPVCPCRQRRETQTLSLISDIIAVLALSLPAFVGVSSGFRLAASEHVRLLRVGTNFYTC